MYLSFEPDFQNFHVYTYTFVYSARFLLFIGALYDHSKWEFHALIELSGLFYYFDDPSLMPFLLFFSNQKTLGRLKQHDEGTQCQFRLWSGWQVRKHNIGKITFEYRRRGSRRKKVQFKQVFQNSPSLLTSIKSEEHYRWWWHYRQYSQLDKSRPLPPIIWRYSSMLTRRLFKLSKKT